jgi:uncharacterized repeat protein (TIGR01451 family)
MRSRAWRSWRAVFLVLATAPAAVSAQTWEVGWWTVDGGGITFGAGGAFEVGATLGQPDAGGPQAGGAFVVHGGFWALASNADLSIVKTDGQASAVPGQALTYTIVASNAGPAPALGARVTDLPPAALLGAAWTCTASPGSACPASGSGPIDEPVDLLAGGNATFTLSGAVDPAATGTLANTASVAAPPDVIDPGAADNSATDTDALTPLADLALALDDAPDPVVPGTSLLYTLQVTNAGPSATAATTLVHTLPAGTSFVSSIPGAPACAHAGGVVTCALGGLGPAGSATVSVQVFVDPSATGVLTSTATAAGDAADPVAANNADAETTTLTPQADLSVSKTDGQGSAVPGEVLTYSIVVGSTGPSSVTGATVTDTPPAVLLGVTWTCVASPGSSCPPSGSGAIAHPVDLVPGGTATFSLSGTIDPAATGTLANTASAAVPRGVSDPGPSNDSATDTDTLTPQADLSLALGDAPDPAVPGGPLTYTLQVTNDGPSLSPGMTSTHTLPAGVSFVSSTPGAPACVHAAGVVTCILGGLDPAESATVTVEVAVSPSATGTLSSTATVAGNAADPVAANNSDTETTSLAPAADLSVSKTDGQSSVVPGEAVTYTIVVGSSGPSAVSGAMVLDTPPAELTGVTWSCSATPGSSCPASGTGAIDASVDLLVDGAATFTLTGTVSPSAVGTLVNTATATTPAGVSDPDPADDSATDTDTLTPVADLGASLSDSPDPVRQGDPLTYTVSVANSGPSTSSGATLVLTLPPEVTFVSSAPGAPICVPGAGILTCSLGAVDPGSSATVTAAVTVGAGVIGTLGGDVSVAGNDPDPVSANDADSEATSVVAATEGELVHGARLLADLGALPGPAADEDRYRFAQRPYSSYEVVLDGASGDLGTGSGPALERLASDGLTIEQSSEAAGAGGSRSLRWENGALPVDDQALRVRSQGCGPDCGPEDVYRLRAYETTCTVARFNSSGTQATTLLLQNTSPAPVTGHVYFIDTSGTLLETVAFSLAAHGTVVVNTAALPGLAGQGGSIRVAHDGRYGDLVGKAVALEPATAFTFDTPLLSRPR